MPEVWYYAAGDSRRGPVDLPTLRHLVNEGHVAKEALVWKEGVETGVPAAAVLALMESAPEPRPAGGASGTGTGHGTAAATSATPAPAPAPGEAAKGFLGTIASKLSALAGVPEIADVPISAILLDGLRSAAPGGSSTAAEDVFAVGTASTTPPLQSLATDWPRPRVFWRILGGAIASYLVLGLGMSQFDNTNVLPGIMVIGSFVVPMALVVFFLEMNTPRNVSIYQLGKMNLLGGTVGLIAAIIIGSIVSGSGTGQLLPALLTGVIEETGKALALMLIVSNLRYPWQLNGLLFGAAVGAGFAGLESAGYAYNSGDMFNLKASIFWRGVMAPGGHVIWTAMIGAAIWEVKGSRPFEWGMLLHKTVVRRWLVAVILHGLWDTALFDSEEATRFGHLVLLAIGWYYIFAILKKGLFEVSVAREAGTNRPVTLADAST